MCNDVTATRARVIIAEDDAFILSVVSDMLANSYDVVAQVADGQSLVRIAGECSPDVAIVDISMPRLTGIEATREITENCKAVKVVILSVHDEPAYVDAAFEAGALAYVLKLAAGDELIPAIEAVRSNRRYLSARLR